MRERIFQPLVEILVGSFRTPGIARMVDVIRRRWTKAGNLDDNRLVSGFSKMSLARGFRVVAPCREGLQFRLVEVISVANAPCSRDNRCDTIVAMRMGCDLGMRRDPKHAGVDPDLLRIAFQDHCLNASDSRASRAWIAFYRELILCRRQALFRRCIKKSTDQSYCLDRPLFHQPMPRSRNHRLPNVRCYIAHDYGLQRTEGLLSAHRKHRHR